MKIVTFELDDGIVDHLHELAQKAGATESEVIATLVKRAHRPPLELPRLPVTFVDIPADFDWSRSTGLMDLADAHEAS